MRKIGSPDIEKLMAEFKAKGGEVRKPKVEPHKPKIREKLRQTLRAKEAANPKIFNMWGE